MRYYFLYRKSGHVVSYSTSQNSFDDQILNQLIVDLNEDQIKMLKDKYELIVKDGDLQFFKTPEILEKEKQVQRESLKANLLEKSKNPQTKLSEVVDLLIQIM